MKPGDRRDREIRKNVLIAVMMTIVVCSIMLTMYFVSNKLSHQAHGDDAVLKDKVSGNLRQELIEPNVGSAVHSLLSTKFDF